MIVRYAVPAASIASLLVSRDAQGLFVGACDVPRMVACHRTPTLLLSLLSAMVREGGAVTQFHAESVSGRKRYVLRRNLTSRMPVLV